MPYTVASASFPRFLTFLLPEVNNNDLLGLDVCVQISQITSSSLNVRRLFLQEVTRLETEESQLCKY